MRKLAVALIVITLLLVGVSPATSAPSPEGTLKAAFNTWFTGGEATAVATFDNGAQAFFYSAPNAFVFDTFDAPGFPNSGIGAIRLSPVPSWPAGPFCDTNTFGIWVVLFNTKADLQEITDPVMFLNGEPLDSIRTPLKPIFDPDGFWEAEVGGDPWWFSHGVPVYGSLDPGMYDISWDGGGGFTLASTIEIVACP